MKRANLTIAEYRALPKQRRHKYGAKRTVVDGIKFASRGEALRWMELKLLQRAGKIKGLTRQFGYSLHVPNGKLIGFYMADFFYWRGNEPITEEFKGAPPTALASWKIKHLAAEYGIAVRFSGPHAKRAT